MKDEKCNCNKEKLQKIINLIESMSNCTANNCPVVRCLKILEEIDDPSI